MSLLKLNLILFFAITIILSSCKFNEKKNEENQITNNKKNSEYKWDGCMVSAYIFQENGRHLPKNYQKKIIEFEKMIDHKIGSVMWYPTFADSFPLNQCIRLTKLGKIPHLTWELYFPDSVDYNTMPIEGNYKLLDEILAGDYDNYMKKFALDAKKVDGEILIRFLHEFNGNWYLWSGNKNGRENGGPQKVVAVWKYVVDIFKSVEAENVKWVWCPHGPSIDVSEEKWNDIAEYWPGNEYVDWIGMDAYNWFPKDPWGGIRPYRDFDNCFRELYDKCSKLGNQPIMIAEFASPEFNYNGKTKKDWVKDALNKIKTEYPRIKMFVWFNINKEMDWRINSSSSVLNIFKTKIKDSYFLGELK